MDPFILRRIAERVDGAPSAEGVKDFCERLAAAGALTRGEDDYVAHPALLPFLQQHWMPQVPESTREAWEQAFVATLGSLAGYLCGQPTHRLRELVPQVAGNLAAARSLARRLEMDAPYMALTHALGRCAYLTDRFDEAGRLAQDLVEASLRTGDEAMTGIAYHQLGLIAQECDDLDRAEAFHRKSLDIRKRLGNEQGAAGSYHELGFVASERGDLAQAEEHLGKALGLFEKLGCDEGIATCQYSLGRLAQGQDDAERAEWWLREALARYGTLGDESRLAEIHMGLAISEQDRGALDDAEESLMAALAIRQRHHDADGVAACHGELPSRHSPTRRR